MIVVDADFSGSGDGAGDANLICGSGISTNGFFVRIINTVVAAYRGKAASIKMPKTNPAKPCKRACARRCHWAALKMLKLNRKYSIAHVISIYKQVHIMACLWSDKIFRIVLIFSLVIIDNI